MARIMGIDIGGSGVKGAIVNTKSGGLRTDRMRIATPRPATPDAVLDIAAAIVAQVGWTGRIGCAVPAVVRDGVVYTAANIHESWIGAKGARMLADRTGCEVHMLNDADAAGIAEMEHGAGRPYRDRGVVTVLTFGTGIGSAVFVAGTLLPNTELGHLELDGFDAEDRAAARLREEKQLTWNEWIDRVNRYLGHLELLVPSDLIVFGGGISKQADKFLHRLKTRAQIVPAVLRNNAGIVGAAMAAHRYLGGKA